VGNEFLDALPVRQIVRMEGGWRERMVGWQRSGPNARRDAHGQQGRLLPVAGDRPMDAAVPADRAPARAPSSRPARPPLRVTAESPRLVAQGGTALLIDYGHDAPHTGSTLQAVRAHQGRSLRHAGRGGPDRARRFSALVPVVAQRAGARGGIVPQGPFLQRLGSRPVPRGLARSAPDHAQTIARASPDWSLPRNGQLFKAWPFPQPTGQQRRASRFLIPTLQSCIAKAQNTRISCTKMLVGKAVFLWLSRSY
jgi:NADH dehydrogenase [ubiquinone] 1 alpha subcomplex assembly factor 7